MRACSSERFQRIIILEFTFDWFGYCYDVTRKKHKKITKKLDLFKRNGLEL